MKRVVLLLAAALAVAGCASQDSAGKRGLAVEAAGDIAVFPQLGHVSYINSAVFSPDGKTIVSGGSDHAVKLWDIATGRELFTARHSNSVESVAFSPDGKTILSASADNSLKLWDAATGREIRTFSERSFYDKSSTTGHSNDVNSAAFSPDGKTIVSGSGGNYEPWGEFSRDNTLRLWNAATGQELRVLSGHSSFVLSVAFSPDGRTIVSGSADKTVKLWDAATGREIRTITGHSGDVNSVAFSPDGKTIVSGSEDKTLKLWDAATGREIRTITGHSLGLRSVAFSPDGKTIVSSSWGSIKFWDAETGRELNTVTGHSDGIYSLAFSPDGKTVLSASTEGSLKLWDAATGRERSGPSGHSSRVYSAAFSPDGTVILSGSTNESVKLWDAVTGRLIRVLPLASGFNETVSFSHNGKIILHSESYTLQLWDAATGQELRSIRITGGGGGSSLSAAISPDGGTIVSGSHDGRVRLWDAVTGQELRTLSGHTEIVRSVAFSPDGKQIISGSSDDTVKLWDAATGREIRTFSGGLNSVFSVAFSPDGKTIASGSFGPPKLWDAASGKEIPLSRENYFGAVHSVAFSPDGKTILAGCWDDTLKLWDLASGRLIRTFTGHLEEVDSAAFSPDGKQIVSGSDDGTVRLWDVAAGKEIVQLVSFTGTDSALASATRGLTVETEAAASSIDSEWLAITPDGYYQASPRGDRYINVRVGNTVTGIDAYRSVLYNPDVVQARLQGRPDPASKASVAIQQAAAFLPPEIALQSDATTTNTATANLSVVITDRNQPIQNIKIMVNGRLLGRDELSALTGATGLEAGRASLTVTGSQKTLNFRLPLALDPGPNRVEVAAFNGYAENRRYIDIARNAPAGEKPPLPGLWILAVGVNKYQDSRIRSLNYCANDAREIIALFKQQEGRRYTKVSSLLIADGEAQAPTAANIRGGLKFLEQAGPRDVILLFLAGHGISEGGAFYFLPGDATLRADGKSVDTDTARTIPGSEITAVLEAPGNRLVFIDACQSGGVDSDRMVRSLMDTNAFVFTSSRGTELSQERPEFGHGVFTYSILQQMRRGRRAGQEGLGMLQLSGDVQIEVPRITGDQQHPSAYSLGFSDFFIGE
jgi:WD40 repeat protein